MEYGIIILCLILSAFFSGMEIAFISSNKIYLEIEKKQDAFISRILTRLTHKPSKFIAAMLIGSNIALVVYGYFVSSLVIQWFAQNQYDLSLPVQILIQTTVATLIMLLTAELIPKVLFQIYANTLIKFFALPAYLFYLIFYYVSTFIMWVSDLVLKRIFKAGDDPVQLFFSKVELGNYINEQVSTMESNEEVDSEIQIFQNALDFSGVKARDIMTPRTEIAAIDIFDTVSEMKDKFIETGYSKILVYQNSVDDIVGYVHSFDLFRQPKTIKSVLIPVEYVPGTIFIKDVMQLLIKKRKSLAVVLDEYGGTAGIIAIEDIVEELFGEIEDEHDSDEELVEKVIDDHNYLFSARLDVEYLNSEYKLAIPEDDSYGTLGGFIVDHTKEIPQTGAQITIGNYHFTIEEATGQKIGIVKMRVAE